MEAPVGNRHVHQVPALPPFSRWSPEVVRVLDRVRSRLDEHDDLAEFCWFAREYPRCYRYQLECAKHRLRSIHSVYCGVHRELSTEIKQNPKTFSCSTGSERINSVYWDFESYLSAVNIALDLLARIVGTAFSEQMPPNFNKLCKKPQDSPVLAVMKAARVRWVDRLKDYRDCFTHYTPVDTMLFLGMNQYSDGFHIRAKLPTNPNVREILGFRYNRRVELLHYSCSVWRHMIALDRAVAKELLRSFRAGKYPQHTKGLFFVGRRERP